MTYVYIIDYIFLVGGISTYPSEKYERQLGGLFSRYGKIKFTFQTTIQSEIAQNPRK